MKNYERRAAGAYPYYKLAVWEPRSFTFKDGKGAYASYVLVNKAAFAAGPGRYRISEVTDKGRTDFEPFEIK